MTRADAWWAAGLVVASSVCGALAYRLSTIRSGTLREVAQLTTLQERVTRLESAAPTARMQTPAISPPPPAPAHEKPAAPKLSYSAARSAYREGLARMYADPQARATLRLAQRSHERGQYPGLALFLGLSPEEEDRLLELLAEQRIAQQEQYNSPERRRKFDAERYEEQARRHDVEYMALLTAEQYRRFKRYQETRMDRMRVRQFRMQLEAKDDLTEESAERLVDVIAAARVEEKRRLDERPQGEGAMVFGTHDGGFLHLLPGEAGMEKAAAQLEDADRRLAASSSAVLNATQQQHFVDYLRRKRESMLALAEEHSRFR